MEDKIGDRHKFSFSNNNYIIKEILDNPQVSLLWTWRESICPHCKKRIEKTVEHIFYKIIILANELKKYKDIILDDILLIGDTLDKRKMVIPIEKYKDKYIEILNKSQNFKYLVKEVK